MLPDFKEHGNLPEGIHNCSWAEFEQRFGCNQTRRSLLNGLKNALESLKAAGCHRAYIDGSFVTSKEEPQDFDGCWEEANVDLSLLDPVLLTFTNLRRAQKIKYRGELFPASAIADGNTQLGFLEYFQVDRGTGERKGIVALDLGNL